ncbi:MAG TPA: luciferase family protein [Alphaproteobacteria bacterium]
MAAQRSKPKPKPGVRAEVTALLEKFPFVAKRPSRYRHRDAFYLERGEFAHFHSPYELDLKLTWPNVKALRDSKAGAPGLNFRKNPSDWLEIDLKRADRKLLRSLLRTAYEAELARKS